MGRAYLLGALLALCILPAALAAPPRYAQVEINYLLALIGASGCDFYRNGVWYDSKRAAAHLRSKYDLLADEDQIKTAEDFIEKAATGSSVSGTRYQIKCAGAAALTTREWLLDALARYRKSRADLAPCAPADCGVRKVSASNS